MTIIGEYEVQEEILARDGQGTIQRGKNSKTGKPALVKTFYESAREQGDSWRAIADPALLLPGEVIKKGKSRLRFIEHPEGDFLGSLIPSLRSRGVWGRYQMLGIFLSVCRAAAALHAHGRAHGAIHPAHILVQKDFSAHLLCFEPSQARLEHGDLAGNEFLLYLSQEQLRGFHGAPADIYALGVLLFQLFGAEPPYGGVSYELAEEAMWGIFRPFQPARDGLNDPRSRAIEPDLETVGAAASKAIQRDVALRYATVADLQGNIAPLRERLAPLTLGLRLLGQGRYGLAASVLEEAALYQDPALAYATLGRIYGLHLNNYERGVLAFKHALRANPSLDSARHGLSELYLRVGHFALAKNEYVEMLSQRPNDLQLLMGYAQVLAQGGNAEGALKILLKAQEENPYFLPAYISAIQLAVAQKDYGNAEAILQRALANILKVLDKGNLNPREVAQVYHERGALHRLQGRTDQALSWMNHALEQDPLHAPSHLALAELYGEKGETDLALKHFTMSLKLNPAQRGLLEGLEKMLDGSNE